MAFRWDIPEKLIYTCNCGWFDKGHANGVSARRLWNDISAEKDKYRQNGLNGYKVTYSQDTTAGGITFNKYSRNFFIKENLSDAEKESVALSIFQEISLGFETQQLSSGITGFIVENLGPASGFSEEDLVSNIAGFYKALRSTDWEKLCKPVSAEASFKIWDRDGPVGWNKNRTFLPNFHECDECSETPQFPFEYQTIKPIEKGILHFDFDEVFATRPFGEYWTPYPLDALRNRFGFHDGDFDFSASRGNFGLGFISVPKKVRIDIKEGESQYFFARRALMIAGFNAGLNFREQLDFADEFYPITESLGNMNKFSMN